MLMLITTNILDVVLILIIFSVANEFGRNVINFGVDTSSSVHVDNKKKNILIFGEGPTWRLDDTTLTAKKKYSINFTEFRKKFCLSLHYNGGNI